MNCIVTAGPTYEPLDDVRRLTNFSTGRLGTELANFLVARGHQVTLLISAQATYAGERRAQRVEVFTTTANLREKLQALSAKKVNAVFHTAAVSDFRFGRIQLQSPHGKLTEIKSKKIPTGEGTLLVELVPTQENHRRVARLVSVGRSWWAGNLKRKANARTRFARRNSNSPSV